MMIKFYTGNASGAAAAAYLEKATDHKGRPRTGVAVLRGDPSLIGQLADSLEFKHRTTSGVIAWAPEDNPSRSEIEDVLDSFERLGWAGLEPDRAAWCAIRHDKPNGGVNVHILAARVDLVTGKSFNIAPPGWQRDFGPWRDYHNRKYHWARPDDPARARAVRRSGHEEKINTSLRRDGKEKPINPKEQLTDLLTMQIAAGLINNRTDVLHALKEYGKITRVGKYHISLKPDGEEKAIRLRGAIYHEHFTAAHPAADTETGRTGETAGPVPGNELEVVREKLEAAYRRRAQFNRRKYGQTDTYDQDIPDQDLDLSADNHPAGRTRDPDRLDPPGPPDGQAGANLAANPSDPAGNQRGGNRAQNEGRDPVPASTTRRTKAGRVQEQDGPTDRGPGEVSDDRTRTAYGGELERALNQPDPLGAAIEENQRSLERSKRTAKSLRRTLEEARAVIEALLSRT